MKISKRLARGMSVSFEVFPPKEGQPLEPLLETLDALGSFRPDFVSVTYGAGGTNRGRSLEICRAILERGLDPLAHITAIGAGREELRAIVEKYMTAGLENFLVLRGDFPQGREETGGDFAHAGDFMAFLHAEFPDICIAAAGYPEKHIASPSFEADIAFLRRKQDLGASFIALQLCHDVDAFARWQDMIRRAGVSIPVIVGIMPVLARDKTIRMTLKNGCSIPAELAAILGKYAGPDQGEDFKKAGMEYTVRQMHRYAALGVAGLHIFTLNKWEAAGKIVEMSGLRRRITP